MTCFFIIINDPVNMGTGAEYIGNPGMNQNRYLRLGEILSDCPYSRGGHNGIPNPISGTNQDLLRIS